MRSFTARIALRFAILVTATTALVLLIGGWLLSREAVTGLDLLNKAEFFEIRDRLGPNPGPLSAPELGRRIQAHTELDAPLYYFQIHNEGGQVVFRSANLGQSVLPDLSGSGLEQTVRPPGLGELRECEYYLGPLHVQIASALGPASRILNNYAGLSLFLLGGVAVVSLALGWGFARVTLRPIRSIHDTATRIRADNLGERIPQPEGSDEIASLVRLLNRMFDGLESAFSQIRRFTADASHELKTPLALLRLNAERLRLRFAPDSEESAALGDLLDDTDRLRRIIDSLLFLAKAESGTFVPALETVDAAALVREFAADASALAEDAQVRFRLSRSDAGTVRCERTLINQLLLNLMTNALRVSPTGGPVDLDSIVSGRTWVLRVTDEGPGLPDGKLDEVFGRFVRHPVPGGAPERNPGHGLGLAICRSIATLHGGTIRAANRLDRQGLVVTVELPLGDPAP
jgi:signal transduction histidine kinase